MVDKNVEDTTQELGKMLKFLLFGLIFLKFIYLFIFQVEALFEIDGIVSEESKLNYLVSQLEPSTHNFFPRCWKHLGYHNKQFRYKIFRIQNKVFKICLKKEKALELKNLLLESI